MREPGENFAQWVARTTAAEKAQAMKQAAKKIHVTDLLEAAVSARATAAERLDRLEREERRDRDE